MPFIASGTLTAYALWVSTGQVCARPRLDPNMSGGWKWNPQPTRNASQISRFGLSRASSCTIQFWVSSSVPSCRSTKCDVFNIPWLAWCSICWIYAVLNPPPTIAPQNPTSLFSWEYVVLVTLQGHTWHNCSHLPTCPFKCICTS